MEENHRKAELVPFVRLITVDGKFVEQSVAGMPLLASEGNDTWLKNACFRRCGYMSFLIHHLIVGWGKVGDAQFAAVGYRACPEAVALEPKQTPVLGGQITAGPTAGSRQTL